MEHLLLILKESDESLHQELRESYHSRTEGVMYRISASDDLTGANIERILRERLERLPHFSEETRQKFLNDYMTEHLAACDEHNADVLRILEKLDQDTVKRIEQSDLEFRTALNPDVDINTAIIARNACRVQELVRLYVQKTTLNDELLKTEILTNQEIVQLAESQTLEDLETLLMACETLRLLEMEDNYYLRDQEIQCQSLADEFLRRIESTNTACYEMCREITELRVEETVLRREEAAKKFKKFDDEARRSHHLDPSGLELSTEMTLELMGEETEKQVATLSQLLRDLQNHFEDSQAEFRRLLLEDESKFLASVDEFSSSFRDVLSSRLHSRVNPLSHALKEAMVTEMRANREIRARNWFLKKIESNAYVCARNCLDNLTILERFLA